MKKLLPLVALVFFANGNSQISYEKGYLINNYDQKIECLIKNLDWKDNPTSFDYKLSEQSESLDANIINIKEFGVYNYSKYIRKTVKIDKSYNDKMNLTNLGYDKNPIFIEKEVFLKVLIEGKANLYLYENGNIQKFFYNKETSKIEQLVYKEYLVSANVAGKNSMFKQQILNDLNCLSIENNQIEKLEYNEDHLIDFFTKYNKCNNSESVNFNPKEKKDLFNLTLRAHLNSTSLLIGSAYNETNKIDFGSKINIGYGVEFELIIPYYKNKWSILVEPNYQNLKYEKIIDTNNLSGVKTTVNVDFRFMEVPIGVRHYIFLNKDSKIFLNASFSIGFNALKYKDLIELKSQDLTTNSSIGIANGNTFSFGVGYKFKDKYSFEVKYKPTRDILGYFSGLTSDYQTLSVILGYTLF